MTSLLAATFLLAAGNGRGQKGQIWKMAAAFLTGQAVYGGLLLAGCEGWSFLAVLTGQAAAFFLGGCGEGKEKLLPELCLYLSADALVLPCLLCEELIWEYVAYFFLLLFCGALLGAAGGRVENSAGAKAYLYGSVRKVLEFYPEEKAHYRLLSLLPCIVLVPEALLLLAVRPENTADALLESGAFLLLLGLALWLQRELAGRLLAEELGRTMDRWQRESRDYMNTIRSQRHDLNLHLHAISGLVGSGEYEACRAYVSRLVAEAGEVNDIMPVSDAVVGSMLYNMREEARKKGSDIVYNITYDMRDVICNGFECNKIIGNLLQNALDALKTPEDQAAGIRLSIFKRRGNTVIVSENRFTGDQERIARMFEPGYSTKRGHEGIGLSMVLRTARLYGGRVYPEFTEDRIRFVVNIPNRVRLTEEEDQK